MAVLAEVENLHSFMHDVAMNEDLNPDDTETRSTDNEMGSEPYAGAFFPRSRNFVVEGGVFTSRITNITHNHHTYPAPHDFRKIPMGDIDLQHEIQFDDNSGVVYLRRGQRRARRRYYSARIETCQTAKTVAWYQGPNAEQVRPSLQKQDPSDIGFHRNGGRIF
ncbi:hypothetical protein C8R47DRAFT_106689 [Mycena vitilis]|nr:hypothetical protein C8R47DRAFT_106689 [Mycena vitilis]